MKRLLFLVLVMATGLLMSAQNTSPLKKIDFYKLPNETVDLKALKDMVGRDTDYDGNKAALIRVKTRGFEEKTMLDFNCYSKGVEMIHSQYKDGELWWYIGSNTQGSVVVKYMGEYEFKLSQKLEPSCVYELIMGMEKAILTIRAVPVDAEIFIDDQKVGRGETISSLTVGTEHRYKVVCHDYYTQEGVVMLAKQEERFVNVELEPSFGYITIISEPIGAGVYIDDAEVGITPYSMKKISIGRHAVELRKDGYISYGDVVTVNGGEHNKRFENVRLEEDNDYHPEMATAKTDNAMQKPVKRVEGFFSVSPNTQVRISKGNLQYQASTKTWRFAEHAWDYAGHDNQYISEGYEGWIDMFGYGTSGWKSGAQCYEPYSASSDYWNYYPGYNENNSLTGAYSMADWGVYNNISNGEGWPWRTPTKEEWEYLFDKRETPSKIRYAKAIVNGVNGILILPDNWRESNYQLNSPNVYYAKYSSNKISQADWTNILEAYGVAFMPAAGGRNGRFVFYVGTEGLYRSSSQCHSSMSWDLTFSDDNFRSQGLHDRAAGYSVRLISDAKSAKKKINGKNQYPTPYIKGKFSVSSTKQVSFSKGNLQYKASTKTWRFAENQWDVIGPYNTYISSETSYWIDLFGWGTSGYNGREPYMIDPRAYIYGNGLNDLRNTKYDWGEYCSIQEGGNKRWFTLTKNEWRYVLDKRKTASGIRYAKATVNNVEGVILLPDDWQESYYTLTGCNKHKIRYSANVISKEDWYDKLEANGAVFLPVTGYRMDKVPQRNHIAVYWSASYYNDERAYAVQFGDEYINVNAWASRELGCAVRLVCPAD